MHRLHPQPLRHQFGALLRSDVTNELRQNLDVPSRLLDHRGDLALLIRHGLFTHHGRLQHTESKNPEHVQPLGVYF